MYVKVSGRFTAFWFFCILQTIFGQDNYVVPEVSIVPLRPSGVVISIPHDPKIEQFDFIGSVKRGTAREDVFRIVGHVKTASNGFWTYSDDSIQLQIGDIIEYYIFIHRGGRTYTNGEDTYVITELFDSNKMTQPTTITKIPVITTTTTEDTPTRVAECRPTSTSILSSGFMQSVCSGQIIFEDDFDTIREDLWTIEEYIPSNPVIIDPIHETDLILRIYLYTPTQVTELKTKLAEKSRRRACNDIKKTRPPKHETVEEFLSPVLEYPFVSYQRSTVSVQDGILRIEPQLQEDLPGFDNTTILYSTLDLSFGCTRPGSCVISSDGGHILPPIASGRITSKMLSFKYASVEVRAKVPQGDWLYTDILLESLLKKYGADDYASGVLKIASVLGNVILKKQQEEYGNKVLSGGPVMNYKCRSNLLVKKTSATEWGNAFHVYTLYWSPDMITLSVDGEEWGRIEVPINGLQTRLPRDKCELLHRTFLRTPIAPFDDYFNIVLGVSAGGVSEFPDGVVSLYTRPKPWINTARRARLNFFMAKESWKPTWTQPALLVDYIKVRAL